MGCFLGCYGFSGKRRHRKPAKKVLPRHHRFGNYEPLDSSAFVNLEGAVASSDSQLSKKIKESLSVRIGKKVSFNLNVETYEPLIKDGTGCQLSELGKKNLEGDTTTERISSFPSNHRYWNCRDSFDDEDDMENIESDLDDEDEYEDEDDEFEYDYDDNDDETQRISQNKFIEELNERNTINTRWQLPVSTDCESKRDARNRILHVNSVLNPLKNITQWKAVKARTAGVQHPEKENSGFQEEAQVSCGVKAGSNLSPFIFAPNRHQSKPLLQDIAVDSSLSNWLASPNRIESMASSFSVETTQLKKSMRGVSCSQQSREDRPIMHITNLKA